VSITASPLSWPLGQKRTGFRQRHPSIKATVSTASVDIEDEVRRMNGVDLVLSTNLQLRIDGFPRSGQAEPSDPGVAVYFTRKGKKLVFACDRWSTVAQNLRAVAMHLAALRGMERWGVGTLDQAFTGYQALPETAATDPWWKVLGCEDPPRTADELQAAYRDAARRAHPDTGGSAAAFVRVNNAHREGREALGVA
jgi:hypothetical protein